MKDDWSTNRKGNPDARMHRPREPKTAKDRKRWCRGKEGREHRFELVVPKNRLNNPCREVTWGRYKPNAWSDPEMSTWWCCNHFDVCAGCGRQEFYEGPCPDNAEGLPQSPWEMAEARTTSTKGDSK